MTTTPARTPDVRMQHHLRPGERLLWAGRPDPAFRIRGGDVFGFVLALVWTFFAVFWELTAWAGGGSWVIRLFGLPFAFLGLRMLVGRPLREHRRKQCTLYAVTDQRAIAAWGTTKLTDVPVLNSVIDVSRSGDNRRATVTLSGPAAQNPDLVMIDVRNPDRLLAALDRARTPH